MAVPGRISGYAVTVIMHNHDPSCITRCWPTQDFRLCCKFGTTADLRVKVRVRVRVRVKVSPDFEQEEVEGGEHTMHEACQG